MVPLLLLTSDLGRQTQIHGRKIPVEEMCSKIDALTIDVGLNAASRR